MADNSASHVLLEAEDTFAAVVFLEAGETFGGCCVFRVDGE